MFKVRQMIKKPFGNWQKISQKVMDLVINKNSKSTLI